MKTANSDGLLSTSAHFLLARLLHSRIFRLPALCPELEPPRFRNHPVCRPVQAERRTHFTERWPAEELLVGEVGTVEASVHAVALLPGDAFTCCSMALRHLLAGMILEIIQVQFCNIRLACGPLQLLSREAGQVRPSRRTAACTENNTSTRAPPAALKCLAFD